MVSGRHSSDQALAVCVIALLATVGIRAWALFNSWFYTDDYRLLLEASDTPLSVAGLLDPFDSQFMPWGLLIVEWVETSGELNWPLAASLILVLSTAAAIACLYMLITLFGRDWHVVPLFLLFLFTSMTTPALMWWAAALNQVAPQACFFLAVAWWVTHLRTGRTRWALATFGVIAIGLGFYIKALLILPALAILTVGHFTSGSLRGRVRTLAADRWRALVPVALLAIGYVVFYRVAVPQPFAGSDSTKIAEVAGSLLGKTMPTGLLGGPWAWWDTTPPIVLADPPDAAVSASWVVLALVVVYSLLQRSNAWPGWILLLVHALADFVLLAMSRGQDYGALAGLDYRYLTDLAPAAVLAVGLVFLPVKGAVSSSRPRTPAVLSVVVPRPVWLALTAAICTGGLVSSLGYIHFWHHDNAGKTYVPALAESLRGKDGLPMADGLLPADVMPGYTQPMNQLSQFTRLLGSQPTFPDRGTEIFVVDGTGQVRNGTVSQVASTGQGPREGCGWVVTGRPKPLTLDPPLEGSNVWVRLGTLSSEDTTLEVEIGTEDEMLAVPVGLSSLFLEVEPGGTDTITLTAGDDVDLCVDRVDVGGLVTR